MLKKNNSEKTTNPNRKFNSGNEIINKLENLYIQSIKKVNYTNRINTNDLFIKKFPPLTKKLSLQEKKSISDNLNKPSKKSLYRYASIDSIIKKSSQKQSQSNEPPTIDATIKYNSPYKPNTKSNIFNSSSKYKIKSDLKTVTEIKNTNIKKYKIKSDDEDNNFNNISLYSNVSDKNNQDFSSNKDINNLNDIKDEKQNNLIKSDKFKKNGKEKGKYNKNNKKNEYLSYSESSLHSYKGNKQEYPHIIKDYYSSMLNNDNRVKKREQLLQSSIDFYLHQQKFISKRPKLKKKEYINYFSKNKPQIFSELKRVPTVIAFGKVVPRESVKIQKQNKNHIFLRPKKTLGHNNQTKNIFRSGLVNNNSIQKLKESKFIKDDYNTNNPNTEDYIPKDQFGNIVYPVFAQKKMLKNIMPKEYDYNTIRSPLELLHDTYHPLLRFQKKMLAQHINAINQEIGVTYSKHFTLVDKNKIPDKYKCAQELIDLQKDEKLIKLIRELIDRNFGLEKEVAKTLDLQKKEKEILRKKQIYKRFSEIMLKASIHFKRLNISLEDFYSIPNYIPTRSNNETNVSGENNKDKDKEKDNERDELTRQNQLIMQKNGQHFFEAIKAGDTSEIIRIMNSNYFIMFYRDHFLQSPLHISAKRNLYKFISLFISRGADINAQDEGGRTALLIAAEKNNLEFVTVLLFEIADPSIKNCKGQKAFEVTTNQRIKVILERAKVLHYFHKIGKIQQFNESIRNGLSFLYKEELGINCDVWLKENKDIIKECEE